MKEEDTLTDIPLYPDGVYGSPHDYGTIRIQGGDTGLVLPRDGSPGYTTAFVECFPPGSFLRGQGTTVAEADDACWAKLQAFLGCPGHIWEPRNYRNGSGICTVCGQYGHDVLTADQVHLTGSKKQRALVPGARPTVACGRCRQSAVPRVRRRNDGDAGPA
jgi:hypothetical protein